MFPWCLCGCVLYFNQNLTKKDFKISETNKGKRSLIRNGFTYRVTYQSKTGGTTCRCTNKACKAVVKTDAEEDSLIPVNVELSHDQNDRNAAELSFCLAQCII